MSIPCTGNDDGVATLVLGLHIMDQHGKPIRGSPIKLKLKKQCHAFGENILSFIYRLEDLNQIKIIIIKNSAMHLAKKKHVHVFTNKMISKWIKIKEMVACVR